MAQKRVSDDDLIAGLQRNDGNVSATARDFGMARSSIQQRMPKLAQRGYAPDHDMKHTVPDGFRTKGVSTLYKTDGSIAAQWVKSTADDERRKAIIEEASKTFMDGIKPLAPRRESRKRYEDSTLSAYPLGDPHVGMRAWAEECGQDWDLAIAQDVHRIVVDDLILRQPPSEHGLLANLGDLLHYDSMMPMTARSGNMLDADGRYSKMIRVATEIMIQFVESMLTRHRKVHVISAIGNHDETGAQWMALLLDRYYSREKRVSVDTSPSVFNYHRFGQNFIGIHHGHTVKKIDQLPSVMATDRPKDWGECKHRAWWTGHIHTEIVRTFPGCIVETFSPLAVNDAYATAGGWRSRENAYGITLHHDCGEIGRQRSNPDIAAAKLGIPA